MSKVHLLSLMAATVWNTVETVKSPVSTAPYTKAALGGVGIHYGDYTKAALDIFAQLVAKIQQVVHCV